MIKSGDIRERTTVKVNGYERRAVRRDPRNNWLERSVEDRGPLRPKHLALRVPEMRKHLAADVSVVHGLSRFCWRPAQKEPLIDQLCQRAIGTRSDGSHLVLDAGHDA